LINKEYDDFKKAMLDFADKAPLDQRAKAFLENPDYLKDLQLMTPRFELNKLSLNSDFSDFGAYEFDGKLYFVSARNEFRKTYGWDNEPSLDIFMAENIAGTFKNPIEITGDINTKYHEGTVAIAEDRSTLYFTRNDFLNEKYRKDDNGVNHLKIYKATRVNGMFQDIQDLPFNDLSFSNSNPALSPDGSQLYFSSDRAGGYGSSDLYVVDIKADGTYGSPQNLGPTLNTEGRENFPFVDEEGMLYFSSDGHLGLGGLDVFYSKVNSGDFIPPQNLGFPLNSNADDFAFTYNGNLKSGFVSSNRTSTSTKKEKRTDNIYRAKLVSPLKQTSVLVEVVEARTEVHIQDAQLIFYDTFQNEYSRSKTAASGNSNNFLPTGKKFDLQVNVEGYESQSNSFEVPQLQMLMRVALVPEMTPAEAEVLILQERIFFDYNKANIKPEAAFELDKLIEILKENEDINIQVVSHTDERGSEAYNMKLSQDRAGSTVDYLTKNGVDPERLSFEGKGESLLVNDCTSGCSNEEHEENRRSEFKIID
jgi:outer membrane protein OmpA-like peptidoglycan-associated protein